MLRLIHVFRCNVHIPAAELDYSVPRCLCPDNMCSCGAGRSGQSPSEDPTDGFYGNRCIGQPTKVDCVRDTRATAAIHDNTYYWAMTPTNSSAVCTNNATSPLERGSLNKPMPSLPAAVAMARAALGMAASGRTV